MGKEYIMFINILRDPYDAGFTPTKPKQIELHPGLTVLVGCNGAGKTTLLMNIEEEARKNHLPVHLFNNLTDGGSNAVGSILQDFGEEGDDLSMGIDLWTASEGEAIRLNLARQSRLYKEFLRSGQYKNRHYRISTVFSKDTKKDSDSNVRILLFDAVDSGMSVDAVVETKAFFDLILADAKEMGLELYLIISANEYELARNANCFDVNEGRYVTFSDYEEYRAFIIASRKKKEARNKKAAQIRENRRQRKIASLNCQLEKKLATYQKLVEKEKAGENVPYYEMYEAKCDVEDIVRELRDYGVEVDPFETKENE